MEDLQSLTTDSLMQRKYAAIDQGGIDNFRLAFRCAEEIYRRDPENNSNFDDIICYSVYSTYWKEAIEYCQIGLNRPANYLNSLDGLSHSYYEIGDWENSAKYGIQALNLRHQEVLDDSPLPLLPTVPARAGKKVISFSLYGTSSFYMEPAVLNAELVHRLYPEWTCRFYIDETVPLPIVKRLLENGAEVRLCDESLKHIPKTMWRFLVLDEKDVAYAIFRDADSVISPREAQAVKEWLESGKYFHTLRDNGSHTDLVLAGLWGAQCGVLPNVREMIEDFVANQHLDKRFADQDFLRTYLWKYMCQSLCAHDSVFDFLGDTLPFIGERQVENFIGRAEADTEIKAEGSWEDGTVLKCRVFSRIDPLFGDNFRSFTLLAEERLICEYDVTVKQGGFTMSIPKRYAVGNNLGYTRITLT